jgi:hypothetical protein
VFIHLGALVSYGDISLGYAMTEEIKSQTISRRRVFWFAFATIAAPAATLALSDVRAQTDQAPAAPAAPKKTTKTKTAKKKTKPATGTDPAAAPAASPK